MIIRQSTARTILVGPVLDASGVAKTDEVVASIKITKNGTVGSADGSATLTHDHAGKYKLALTANDTDTVGVLEISLNSGTNDMPVKAINVVETAVWDSLFADGATGMLPANVVQISGDATAADNLEAALDGTGGVTLSVVLGTDAITAASLADSAGAELAALVETYIVNEGDATAVMQAIADKIAADWVAGDASPLAIASAVWSAATRTITGGSLTTAPPTAAAIADAVWDEARTGHTTSGTFGFYLDAAISGISGGGGSGTGARTVTITVNDGTTVLQNATVRMTEGANTFTASTNASGVATFNLDDATYTVAITKPGYSYSGTTLVVNGTEAETYSMTAITITPSTGDQTTGYLTTLDETGAAESGVSIYVSVADVPNDYGLALDEATRTVVSDEDGLVEITGMVKGATYNLRRGLKGRLFPVTIPTSAGSTYELPNMAGV